MPGGFAVMMMGRQEGWCESVTAGWLAARAGWLLRTWCLEETCPFSSFLPSKRQGDRAAESVACHQ